MYKTFKLLMDTANDGTGGGAGGGGQGSGGSLLTTSTGGGTSTAGAGNAGAAQGAAGNQSAGNPGANNGAQGGGAPDWRSQLPQELQEDANLKKFTSISALASSYLNAQKLIGGDKIPVPSKHATDEDWGNVFRRLGNPEKIEDYQVKFKDTATVDEKFATQYREQAHKLGILPKQAQAMADWFSDLNAGSEAEYQATMKQQFEASVANMKKDWGNAFDVNIARANKVIDELAKEDKQYFIDSGLGGNEKFMRFMAKIGETLYKEDKIVGEGGGVGQMSPKELDESINKLKIDPAYINRDHPNHKTAVAEMKNLFELRFPAKNQ